jgi:aspartate 1-decarboxylase
MLIEVLKSKIHRATVTGANLDYEGSISIDSGLLSLAYIKEYQAIHVWNVTNGSRLKTYVIKAPDGSGEICINGAGAHLNKVGDLVILATFATIDEYELNCGFEHYKPKILKIENSTNTKFSLG